MALRNTILNGVDTVFRVLGDLAVDVTLIQSDSSGYDFSTGRTNQTPSSTTTVRGVLLTADSTRGQGQRDGNTLILRARDVVNMDVYDSFVIEGRQYDVQSYTNNGYTIEVQVSGG